MSRVLKVGVTSFATVALLSAAASLTQPLPASSATVSSKSRSMVQSQRLTVGIR